MHPPPNLDNLRYILRDECSLRELRQLCATIPVLQPLAAEATRSIDPAGLSDRIVVRLQTSAAVNDVLAWLKQNKPAALTSWQQEGGTGQVEIGDIEGGLHDTTIAGGDVNRTRIGQTIVNIFGGRGRRSAAQRNRRAMLQRVRRFWIEGVLDKSLHGLAMLQLGLADRAQSIDNPLNLTVHTALEPMLRPLPASTHIYDVFAQLGRCLLILGDPGSGKTTTLLRLAQEAIERAEQDPVQPIPVILNLSSWRSGESSMVEWLVTELKSKYQIPESIGRQWVQEHALLFLLDGLDEVAPTQRESCLTALNAFSEQYGVRNLVVCSRSADYAALSGRLKVQGAIELQPLTDRQVARYLEQAGPALAAVQLLLKEDEILRELTHSPLVLSVMTLAYRDAPVESLRGYASIAARREHLFTHYVDRMFRRTVRTQTQQFSKIDTLRHLGWLAVQMQQHHQSMFLLEGVQPSWLASRTAQWFYVLTSRLLIGLALILLLWNPLLGVAVGLAVGVIDGLRFELTRWMVTPPTGCVWAGLNVAVVGVVVGFLFAISALFAQESFITLFILGGLFGGLLFGLRGRWQTLAHDIRTVEALRWGWPAARRGIWQGGVLGAIVFGATGGLTGVGIGWEMVANTDNPPLTGVLMAIGIGGAMGAVLGGTSGTVLGALLGGMFGGLRHRQVETRSRPNQGIRLSLRNAALVGILFGIAGLLIGAVLSTRPFRLEADPREAIVVGLAVGLFLTLLTGLWYGGLDAIQHYTLRLILVSQGHTPRRYTQFLDHATERVLLRKVGGGYIFIHRLLQEYFASLDLEKG